MSHDDELRRLRAETDAAQRRKVEALRELVEVEREKGIHMTRQHAGLHTPESRSQKVKAALNRAAEQIAGLRDDVRSIDANWSPDGRERPRYATVEEWNAYLAAQRAQRKVEAEDRLRVQGEVVLRELVGVHVGALDGAVDDVKRARSDLDARSNSERLSARREEVRALIAAPSTSMGGSDAGQRIASAYQDALKFGDELGARAIRAEAAELASRAVQNQADESSDTVALRELYHQFDRDAKAERAALDAAKAEVAELEALAPKVTGLVRQAQTEAGLTPEGLFTAHQRGEWEQSILGQREYEDGSYVVPDEPAAVEPEAGVVPESDSERLERLGVGPREAEASDGAGE